MAGNFQGWLIKFGNVQLPNSYLLADGWESTPNQRVDIDSWRDANILLHRTVSENFKTKLRLNIREMNLTERMAFDNVVGLASLPKEDNEQRRVSLTYWNDETLDYAEGIFYMPDPTYKIYTVDTDNRDIQYDPFTVTLIEY